MSRRWVGVRRRRVLTRAGGRARATSCTSPARSAPRGPGWRGCGTRPARRRRGRRPGRRHAAGGPGALPPADRARAARASRVARARAASACMDLSDGLADAVTQVAEASGVGAEVDAGGAALSPGGGEAVAGDDAGRQALLGGDDYELLFAVPPRRRRAFLAASGQGRRVRRHPHRPAHRDREGLRVDVPTAEEPLPAGTSTSPDSAREAARWRRPTHRRSPGTRTPGRQGARGMLSRSLKHKVVVTCGADPRLLRCCTR